MPKLKTNRAAAKRFRISKNGKVKFAHKNKRHLLASKSPKRRRQARRPGQVCKGDMGQIKQLMPYG